MDYYTKKNVFFTINNFIINIKRLLEEIQSAELKGKVLL